MRGDGKKVAVDYQDKQYDDVERNFQEVLGLAAADSMFQPSDGVLRASA